MYSVSTLVLVQLRGISMKGVAIMMTVVFALAVLILMMSNTKKCEKGYHSMGNGNCMSNMERM